MDRLTRNYIEDIAKPLLHRIQALERENEELKIRVKYLESLMLSGSRSYQKPTVSAANHMRESKISREERGGKRPGWDSKTKIDSPPAANLAISLERGESPQNEKTRTKPPVPKAGKSTSKEKEPRNRSVSNSRSSHNRWTNPSKPEDQPRHNDSQNPFQQNIAQIRDRSGQIGHLNYIFQQLVRTNTDILCSMKQGL